MKQLYILKLGSTWPETARRIGDFDAWTMRALGAIDIPVEIVDAEHGQPLPQHDQCAGIIMTGSHAMVTEALPWSVNLEAWLRDALDAQIPMLGVCYGHQLLAKAAGGIVDYLPKGREIGTVEVRKTADAQSDLLFADMPNAFFAHTTHAQSVLELPPAAIHLALNAYERNHAFRIGPIAWGVQFHPEYDQTIMREYIQGLSKQLEAAGHATEALLDGVTDTPYASSLLQRFAKIVTENSGVRLPA